MKNKLIVIIILFCMAIYPIKTQAELIESIIWETKEKSIIDNHYNPSSIERLKLNNLVNRWYRKHKNQDNKQYVEESQNYICSLVTYDFDYKNSGWETYSPYTVFTTRKMVCTGYSMLMKKILNKKGIINILIHDIKNNHMYNKVYYDYEWHNIDVSNYDAEMETKELFFKTFGVTIEDIINSKWNVVSL